MNADLIIIGKNSGGEAFFSFINKPSTPRAPRKFTSRCLHVNSRVNAETGEVELLNCRNSVASGKASGWLCGYHDSLIFPTKKLDPAALRQLNSAWEGRIEPSKPTADEIEVLNELLGDEAVGYGHGV